MKETDLFLPVKRFLVDKVGCSEVYGEVLDCDVLGLDGAVNVIVELKTRLSFHLLDQAFDRLDHAHYVYIAVPERKTILPRVVRMVLEQKGIGLLYVRQSRFKNNWYEVFIEVPARFNRQVNKRYNIRNHIRDYHKEEVGGVPSGEGKTSYSLMIEHVKRYLRRSGWSTIDEILNHCETHYAQPKPSLSRTLMEKWNEDWCEVKVENGVRYFRYIK